MRLTNAIINDIDCFHTRAKVSNLNDHLNCAIWIIIRMTVFWTVCTQIYIAMHDWIAQFKWWSGPWFELRNSNYASRCNIRMIIQIAHFCSRVKTVIVLSSENPLHLVVESWANLQRMLGMLDSITHKAGCWIFHTYVPKFQGCAIKRKQTQSLTEESFLYSYLH